MALVPVRLLGCVLGNGAFLSRTGKMLFSRFLGATDQPQQRHVGGLAGIMGAVLGGGGQSQKATGPLAGLLGGGGNQSGASGLLGSLMGASSNDDKISQEQQHAAANDQAALMIRAMVNAAKSSARFDRAEQDRIISILGDDISEAEINFLRAEFCAPFNVADFARSVPNGLRQQIYAVSITSVELESEDEAQYLKSLAQALGIDPVVGNQIHEQLGLVKIFS